MRDGAGLQTGARAEQQEINIHDYLQILYRRRYLAALVFVVTVGSALLFSLRAVPMYRANTTLVVEGGGFSASELLQGQVSRIKTLAEIVRSRSVATRAVRRAGIDPAEAEGIRGRISVIPVEDTSIILVEVTDPLPGRVVQLANAVAEEFIALSFEVRKRQAVAVRQFLESQVAISLHDVQRAEGELLQFSLRERIFSQGQATEQKVQRQADLEMQKTLLTIDRGLSEIRMREARRKLGELPELSPSSFGPSPLAMSLRQSVLSAEIELAALRERFADAHPAVVALRARIADLQDRLASERGQPLEPFGYAKNTYYSAFEGQIITGDVDTILSEAQERVLDGLIQQVDSEISRLPPKELAFARLSRNVRLAEGAYVSLLSRLQGARIDETSLVPDIRVVDPAQAPAVPVGPSSSRNVAFGAALGLVLALGAALGADFLDRSIRTVEEAEHATGLPVLGVIPRMSARQAGGGEFVVRGRLLVAAHANRNSGFAEAFRGLRTSLMFSSPDRPLRTVMIASGLPGEGKTTIAVNLAISFAAMGRRVRLVEADLRRPSQMSRVFGTPGREGLTDYLVDAVPLEQAVRRVAEENIEFVPVGSVPPNPAELLGSEKMRTFIDSAAGESDLVICDSAPVLSITDSLLLAPRVDGVILLVEAQRTPRDALQHTHQRLLAAGARVVGIVMTKLPTGRGAYGYYGYGYYGYKYGRSSEATAEDV